MAIIHLDHLLPNGSSDLPGGRSRRIGIGRAALVDASLFGLAPRGVCLAAHVTTRAGALLPHHFTHHPLRAGLFSVALVVIRQSKPPDAPPLAGSLPCSVRTFLSRLTPA